MSGKNELRFSSSVTLERQNLWLGTLSLYNDVLEASGWTWTGLVRREVSLGDTSLVERWEVEKGSNFVFHEKGDLSLHCRVTDGAFSWRRS
jgi:hypothetical protein